ncbi:MAG TPA: MOSC domain-containing protein [Pirellulales bacterium]
MTIVEHLTTPELEAGLEHILLSPKDGGQVELIVRRPAVDQREEVALAELDPVAGLIGDNWKARGDSQSPEGLADPDAQITIMNARFIALVAQTRHRWALAGDQLYIDLDLSAENLPAGTRLAIGSAVVEITAAPHTGCQKFKSRFGADAWKFTYWSKHLRFRGINAKVVQAGTLRVGDLARKVN